MVTEKVVDSVKTSVLAEAAYSQEEATLGPVKDKTSGELIKGFLS